MKAIRVTQYGGPDALHQFEIDVPAIAAGEALVKLNYAGVNFIDVYMRDGTYAKSHTYKTPLPLTLGMEGAGEIVQLPPGQTEFSEGDVVAYCLALGSYAEYAAVPLEKLVRVPEGVPLQVATTLMLQGSTAHYLANSAFALGAGHTCLIHAGAGGVGQLLIQLARQKGARVIANVGSEEKAEIARQRGAHECILYRQVDFADEVLRLTEGEGVDVVYDSVGKATIHQSLRSLKRRGYCINFGASSGQAPPIAPLELAEAGSVFLTRPHLADYLSTRSELQGRADDLFAAYTAGTLQVQIDREFPLAEVSDAHRTIEARKTLGKLILDIS